MVQAQTSTPTLVLVSAPEETVTIEVDDTQRVLDIEPELPVTKPELPEEDTGGNPASLSNFLRNIQRVIGNETLSLIEVHERLKAVGLMPATDDGVHYIRFQLSQHRPLFERPTRDSVSLTEESTYFGQEWKPVKEKKAKKAKKKAPPASVVAQPSITKIKPVTAKKPAKEKPAKEKPAKVKKPVRVKPLVISPIYLSWLGNPMVQTAADKATFEGDGVQLSEKLKGDTWVCKIYFPEMDMTFIGEAPKRHNARRKAEVNMENVNNKLNILVYRTRNEEEE